MHVICCLVDLDCLYNHVIPNGHANTYAFRHKGHNLTLTPLPAPIPLKSKLVKGSEKKHIYE